jgi:hypothetical protein
MEYEMEMVDDLMTLIDGDGHGSTTSTKSTPSANSAAT